MKNDIKDITKQLEQGVKDVFESKRYKEYLDCMSKFYNYSVNNIFLIMAQKPDASLVAGYKAWQTKFNRQVRKGEKGITILAPCPHKKKIEKDGEEKEVNWTTFRAIKVFDVSQTDGEPLPDHYVDELTGEVTDFKSILRALTAVSPCPITFDDIRDTCYGFYDRQAQRIVIKVGLSEQQTIKTAVHEIAHAILHDKDKGTAKDADGKTREVQAESVAYTVCQMLGLDTSDYSFGYVAGWSSGKEIKELTDSMEVIRSTAKDIVKGLKAA